MAESLKEAEKEVKEGKTDLSAQVAQLEKESNPTKSTDVDSPTEGDEQKKVVNAQTQNIIDSALSSQSSVKFDGTSTKVDTADPLEESNQSEKEKKVAIRQALEDVDDELGIKHEKKVALIEAGKDTKGSKTPEKPKDEAKP